VQKNEKKSVGLLELETAVLECFLVKTPLSPLGIKHVYVHRSKTILKERWMWSAQKYFCA
jgi:hypothetical protein